MTTNLTLVVIVGVLVACGVYLLLERSIIKMLLGLLLIGNGVNLLIIALSGPAGDAPVVGSDNVIREEMADPLAQAMVLTSIVITMGIAAFVLALTYRSYSIRARDEVENDPEDTMVSQRRTLAEAPGRDRSDDPVTGVPSKSGDAFDAEGNPIPLDQLTNIEDIEVYEDLHDGDFDDPTDSAYDDPRNPGSGNPRPRPLPSPATDDDTTGDGATGDGATADDGKTGNDGKEGDR